MIVEFKNKNEKTLNNSKYQEVKRHHKLTIFEISLMMGELLTR